MWERVFFSREVYVQALPAVGLPHPQQYVATLFKTAQLTTATDIDTCTLPMKYKRGVEWSW